MRESMVFAFVPSRIGAVLLGSMGGLGLLLAMVGLYGVMTFAVSRRTPEIGIRVALGASRPTILRMALHDGLALVGAGVAIGLAISVLVTRPLAAFLASGAPPAPPRAHCAA